METVGTLTTTAATAKAATSAPHLLDFPDAWLSQIAEFAPFDDLLEWRHTCTTLRRAAEHALRVRPMFISALHQHAELAEAIRGAVRIARPRITARPNLVFFFLSPSYASSAFAEGLHVLQSLIPDDVVLLGCHGVGLIGRDESGVLREIERGAHGVSLAFAHVPHCHFHTAFLPLRTLNAKVVQTHAIEMFRSQTSVRPSAGAFLVEALQLQSHIEQRECERDAGSTPTVIMLSSPTSVVSDVLQVLRDTVPHILVTGALASGPRPPATCLFVKRRDGPIERFINGIATLTLLPSSKKGDEVAAATATSTSTSTTTSTPTATPPPPSSLPTSHHERPAFSALVSRGSKAISAVYRVVASKHDMIERVTFVRRSLEPTLTDEERIDAAIRSFTSPSSSSSYTSTLNDSLGGNVHDIVEVLAQVMQSEENHDDEAFINGLFVGLSHQIDNAEGRVLCDMLEVKPEGIRIDVDAVVSMASCQLLGSCAVGPSLSSSSASLTSPFSLNGMYVQFFELHPGACIVDLASRLRAQVISTDSVLSAQLPMVHESSLLSTAYPTPALSRQTSSMLYQTPLLSRETSFVYQTPTLSRETSFGVHPAPAFVGSSHASVPSSLSSSLSSSSYLPSYSSSPPPPPPPPTDVPSPLAAAATSASLRRLIEPVSVRMDARSLSAVVSALSALSPFARSMPVFAPAPSASSLQLPSRSSSWLSSSSSSTPTISGIIASVPRKRAHAEALSCTADPLDEYGEGSDSSSSDEERDRSAHSHTQAHTHHTAVDVVRSTSSAQSSSLVPPRPLGRSTSAVSSSSSSSSLSKKPIDLQMNPLRTNTYGSLLFTCAGRGVGLFNRSNVDASVIEQYTDGSDVCGFFCNGEIGPPARCLQMQEAVEPDVVFDAMFAPASSATAATTATAATVTAITISSLSDSMGDERAAAPSVAAPSATANDDLHFQGTALRRDSLLRAFLRPPPKHAPGVMQSFSASVMLFHYLTESRRDDAALLPADDSCAMLPFA